MARYVVICSYAVSWKRNYKDERCFDCEENINKLVYKKETKTEGDNMTRVYHGNGGYEHAGMWWMLSG